MDGEHGLSESRKNQRPVSPSDFLKLPSVLDDPDSVSPGNIQSRDGQERLFFKKKLDGKFIATVEVRPAKRHLAFISMFQ